MNRSRTLAAMVLGGSALIVAAGCGGSDPKAAVSGTVTRSASATRTFTEPSESMLPTLKPNQIVTVTLGTDVTTGDIAVFHPPVGADTNTCGDLRKMPDQACDLPTPEASATTVFIKRIVAGPGDTLYIKGGHVYVNGKLQRDGFTRPCEGGTGCDFPTPIKIAPGYWFRLGDNRGESDDSRFWGPVRQEWIVGTVVT